MTTDMDDDKRWTIKAFDTKHANKKETPPMNEAVGGYEDIRYSQWEQEALKREGFHWVSTDKEWFNDNYRGNQTVSIYKDGAANEYIMLHTYYDGDGQYKEEFDHFKDLHTLIEELPRQ